jgi:hypothetical protein
MAKKAYRVRNWNKYNKALVARGSITFWINEKVAKEWYSPEKKHVERGRPKVYSDVAIETCLVLRVLYKFPLRAVQGLIESLFQLIGIKITVPSYTQLCRRQKELNLKIQHTVKGKIHVVVDGTGLKIFGEGEWKVRQHGYSKHRMWRKLHIGIDVKTQQIVMMELTDNKVGENKKLKGLLEQYKDGYEKIGGDKGYDSYDCHEQVGEYGAVSAINIQEDAKERRKRNKNEKPLVRDEITRRIAKVGKEQWKKEVSYHSRSLVETAMFRYKTILGNKMHARNFENQKVEALIGCNILNKFSRLGMPESYAIN